MDKTEQPTPNPWRHATAALCALALAGPSALAGGASVGLSGSIHGQASGTQAGASSSAAVRADSNVDATGALAVHVEKMSEFFQRAQASASSGSDASVTGALVGGLTSSGEAASSEPDAPEDGEFRTSLRKGIVHTVRSDVSTRADALVSQARQANPRTKLSAAEARAQQVQAIGAMTRSQAQAALVEAAGHTRSEARSKLQRFEGKVFVARSMVADARTSAAAEAHSLVGFTADGDMEVIAHSISEVDGEVVGSPIRGYQSISAVTYADWAASLQS